MPNFVKIGQAVAERIVQRLLRYHNFLIFQDDGRLPSWMFTALLDHTQSVFSGLHWCAKFRCNPSSSFDIMKLWIFCVWLENAYSRPQNFGFLGIWPAKWGSISTEPQRHILAWKDVIWRIDRQNPPTGANSAHDKETKKTTKPYGTVENCVFAHPAHVMQSSSSGNSYKFQVHQHQLSSYWAVSGRKLADFGWSHYLSQWLIQQPYSHMAMMFTC